MLTATLQGWAERLPCECDACQGKSRQLTVCPPHTFLSFCKLRGFMSQTGEWIKYIVSKIHREINIALESLQMKYSVRHM